MARDLHLDAAQVALFSARLFSRAAALTNTFETLLSNEKRKRKRLLGWRQQHYWRDEVKRFNP